MLALRYRFGAILLVAITLSACKKDLTASSTEDSSAGGPVTASMPAAEVATPNPNVDFSVTPDVVRGCSDAAPIVAEVKWEVRDPSVAEVVVEVGSTAGAPRKLLSQAGRQGSVSTDAWVVAGTKFFLSELATGKELGSVAIKAATCN